MSGQANARELAAWLRTRLADCGVFLLGCAPAERHPERQAAFGAWVEAGHAGGMDWMRRHVELKYNPQAWMPECRGVVALGQPYAERGAAAAADDPDSALGLVARYARRPDYHRSFLKFLKGICRELAERHPGHQFRPFVDTGPLDERFYAQAAGGLFVGRNHLGIVPGGGSWFSLGLICCSLPLAALAPPGRSACPPGCGRCVAACPSGALRPDGVLAAERCLAYLSIEHEGAIDPALRPAFGRRVFGCDACQEACPHNRPPGGAGSPASAGPIGAATGVLGGGAGSPASAGPIGAATYGLADGGVELIDLLTMDEFTFNERFGGTPIKRSGLARLRRNAAVAAGNVGGPELLEPLRCLRDGGDALLAELAAWAMERIRERRPTPD